MLKIGFHVNFRKAKLPSKKRLVGKYTVLEPLQIKKHSNFLFKIFSKDKPKERVSASGYPPAKWPSTGP